MDKAVSTSKLLRIRMLASVLEFLKRTGTSDRELRQLFETSLGHLATDRAPKDRSYKDDQLRMGNENLSAALLRAWHRDGRLIDRDARPRPLALSKGRHNLSAVIRGIDPKANAAAILKEMRAVKLIRKCSKEKYLPTSESAIVSKLHPLAIDHIAKLIIRLVNTVSRNVESEQSSLALIERHAYAPDLDEAERKAFAEFTRVQGMSFLESVDNWLEQRRIGRKYSRSMKANKGIPASVHLFAYLGDGESGEVTQQKSQIGKVKARSLSRINANKLGARRHFTAREARA